MPLHSILTSACVALSLAPFACTRTTETPPATTRPIAADPSPSSAPPVAGLSVDASIATAPTASASASLPAVPMRLAPPSIASWTDADVVAALAADCNWQPEETEPTEMSSGRFSGLSCKFLFEQSCVPDSCWTAKEETCKPKCTATCTTCGKTCSTTCAACKRACKDDACKLACATSCGACRQACVQGADRCVTGTCGAELARCNKSRDALLQKHEAACAKVCEMAGNCPGTCSEGKDMSGCMAGCRKRFVAAGCPEEFFGTCAIAGPGALGLPSGAP